jgi:signal transduction histidine kinase
MNPLDKGKQNPRRTWARVAIILGLTIILILLFKPILNQVGPVGSALVAIPIALAGWYFGVTAGLMVSFLGIGLITVLLTIFSGVPWSTWIVNGWPGDLMLIGAGFIAGRLQKAWGERLRLLGEMRSRERYLTLINITTRDILNPQNPEGRYFVLLTHLVNLFVADYAHLFLWDAAREKAILTATTVSKGQEFSEIVLDQNESGMITSALEAESPQVINDISNSKYIVNPGFLSRILPSAQSALCIPLLAKEYRLGVVVLVFDHPSCLTSEDLKYAGLAGNQVALAMYSIQQESKLQKQLKETRALANIERALSVTERVGIETVLQLIVDSAKELIPAAKEAVLHLLDEERKILIPRAVAGVENKTTGRLNMRLGEGIAGQVIMTREIISVSDTQTDLRFFKQAAPVKFRSLIVAPIQGATHSVGTISIQSEQPNAFTPDEAHLLGALGTLAAIAIENANLLETTQQDLREINALYHISQGLVASLDPDQLMKDVVELLQKDFGFYHVQIYELDPKTNALVAGHGSGKIGVQLKKQGYRLPLGMGIIGHTAETGEPFTTNNVEDVIFFVRNPLLPDTQSEMTIPIKIEGQVLGVLDIQQTLPSRLSRRQMKLMGAVADQLAVALQKANLYTKLQESLHQEKAMRTQLVQSERLALVGRLLASVSHELNNPIQAIQNVLFLIKEEEKLSTQGRQDLEIILSETERMSSLIDRLRTMYRPTRTEDFQEVQLNGIIEDIRTLTATHMRHNDIRFEFLPDPKLPAVSGIPDQLRQVTLNLFMNAIEAMRSGGCLTVRTERLLRPKKVLLTFSDTGAGIDPEILPRIFEPFITTKENGTGLGLTITYDIIHQHHGDIQAENGPQGGAVFKVWLPVKRKG